MSYPVYLPVGHLRLHPHWVFEALGYAIGFRVYLTLRRRNGDLLGDPERWRVFAAAAVGAALGSKLLFWFEDPWTTLARWHDPVYLLGGKTIVGALLGGLVCVEWVKSRLRIHVRTGDLFALPLVVGIAIGRIGCFLSGAEDHTAGKFTPLPWGVDFGDGPRHPTQLYEILFMIILGLLIFRLSSRPHTEGDLFNIFMVCYMAFRLVVDFLKPEVRIVAGLSSIQWVCAITLVYYVSDIRRWFGRVGRISGFGIPVGSLKASK